MALVRIGGNLANKLIVLAVDPDTMPATVGDPAITITSLGTFEHAFGRLEADDVLPGSPEGLNHVLFQHVREVLYKRSAANLSTAVTAPNWPNAITDLENWKIISSGVFFTSEGLYTRNTANLNIGNVAATGNIVFSAQPEVNSTITINGTVFTFVASGAAGNQINIGAALTNTVTNMATVLNASVVAGVALATYGATGGTTLTVTFDVVGPTGEAFTLAASTTPASNGTCSAATLRRTGPTATLVTKHTPSGTVIAVGNLNFVSDDTSIATVSAAGVVTAVKEGTARIRVTRKDGLFNDQVNEARVKVI